MRERARDKGRLEDIVEYSNNVTMLIQGYSLEALVADKRTYYSVMKNVEIVGEAAYKLTKAFKDLHPKTPWKIIQGMRHILVHEYANIDDKELYNAAVNDIPELRNQVKDYLVETDWEQWVATPDDFVESVDDEMSKIASRMKARGYDVDEICSITGLTKNEIASL